MKKKGLIVATIVMVLVLAVSLTTATYAWFSSQAKATVEHLAISTTAASGVQIAVYEGNDYHNGMISYYEDPADNELYPGKNWAGDAEGFGMLLDFANIEIGTMVNAVTNNTKSGDFVYTPITVTPDQPLPANTYTLATDGKPTEATGNAQTGVTYYKKEACTTGNFYLPTGYNANVEPLGYVAANPNTKDQDGAWTSYYEIPLAMQTVKETNAIVCSIAIKNSAASNSNNYPGMAAATRIRITAIGSDGNAIGTHVFQPYSAYEYRNGAMTRNTTSTSLDSTGVLNFVVADGTIATTDVYKLKIEIWVEGTDPECHTGLTDVTNFDVDFGFDIYSAESFVGGSNLTITPQGGTATTYQFITGLSRTITPPANSEESGS